MLALAAAMLAAGHHKEAAEMTADAGSLATNGGKAPAPSGRFYNQRQKRKQWRHNPAARPKANRK